MTNPSYLSDDYWKRLTPKAKDLYLRIRPMPSATYTADQRLDMLEQSLAGHKQSMEEMGGRFELTPDFQRGHVWSREQRQRYVESFLRGQAPRAIIFNCPGWTRGGVDDVGDIAPHTFQCIDGLQRLTAIRQYVAGEVSVFEGLKAADLVGTPFEHGRFMLQFMVYEFRFREDLLNFYLDLNRGGTVHSHAELALVEALLKNAVPTSKKGDK